MSSIKRFLYSNGDYNGYHIHRYESAVALVVYDMGQEIESLSCDLKGNIRDHSRIDIKREDLDLDRYFDENQELLAFVTEIDGQQRWSGLMDIICCGLPKEMNCDDVMKMVWAYERKNMIEGGLYEDDFDIMPYYIRQDELKEKIISDVDLELNDLDWIAGCDVGYSEETDQMVGAIVVFDAKTMKTVESATHQMKISFPYIPGLFSYREIPPILHAFEKLKIRPDLIVCDAHGISHPRGIGMASHLGVMLDIPTIGCAKKRLIGAYDKSALKVEKGHSVPLRWNSRDVGAVLRSRADVKPVFVSIGHKINLESSIAIILELCQKYRLPETTRHADRLVNQILKSRTGIEDI